MQNLTVKTLIGLTRLTLSQLVKCFNHYNYKLRNSQFIIMNDELDDSFCMPFSEITGIQTNGEISYIKEGSEAEEKMILGANQIMIIYKESIPKFAVFYD